MIFFSPLPLLPLSPLWTIFHVVYVRVLLLAMCRCSVFDVAAVAEFLPGIIIASIVRRLRVRSVRLGRYNLGAAVMKEGEAAWTNLCGCMVL